MELGYQTLECLHQHEKLLSFLSAALPSFFSFLSLDLSFTVCVCIYMHIRGLNSLDLELQLMRVTWLGCWDLNSGLLWDQQALESTEPSPKPHALPLLSTVYLCSALWVCFLLVGTVDLRHKILIRAMINSFSSGAVLYSVAQDSLITSWENCECFVILVIKLLLG